MTLPPGTYRPVWPPQKIFVTPDDGEKAQCSDLEYNPTTGIYTYLPIGEQTPRFVAASHVKIETEHVLRYRD